MGELYIRARRIRRVITRYKYKYKHLDFKNYLPLLAACFMATGCGGQKQSQKSVSGIDLTNLNTSVSPGDDFYKFACGGWMEKHPLTDEYARYGSFDLLAENSREQVRAIIEDLGKEQHEKGSVEQKIGTIYSLAMDSVKLNSEGVLPIQGELKAIADIANISELTVKLAELQKIGVTPYFTLYVSADNKNSALNIVHTYQSGLGLGQKDYYFSEDEATVNIRKSYIDHISKMFELVGFDSNEAKQATDAVWKVESSLAEAFFSPVELRDPHANYNILTIDELKANYSTINWTEFLETIGLPNLNSIDVRQTRALAEANKIIAELPLSSHIAYLQWSLINSAASFLGDDFVNQDFEFYGKVISGKEQMQPRWKRAVAAVDGTLGEAVGQMYVEKHFPPAAKERMIKLVDNLQSALGERIEQLEWMSEETKLKANEKLATFHVKIGYPNKWKDYSTLDIENDNYWSNVKRVSRWSFEEMIAKAGQPVDNEEWFMNPQTVNAYYSPATNEICFPAGILQYPFFDMNADDAFNYGAIGVVIGHEMTHGFDDQGRQFDKEGNLKDWWTTADSENFDSRAQVMIDFFNAIEVAPGVTANGEFTLGENIADHGGLQISFQAFQNASQNSPLEDIDGFTPEQRFFLAYSNVWANNIRPEEILNRTKTDPHSLGEWRVNGALPHIDAWYKAFNITEEHAMFLPKEKRVSIW